MRQHVIPAVIAAVVSAGVGYGAAVGYKPKPVIVQPQTTIVTRGASDVARNNATSQVLTRSEQRRATASWGELAQPEIDALSVSLKSLPKTPLTIFCWRDDLCGDMQLDFDNAFETSHWDTKLETPLIDDTIGVATSREDLRDAINQATNGRLAVKIIQKNAAYDVLVIGKKK